MLVPETTLSAADAATTRRTEIEIERIDRVPSADRSHAIGSGKFGPFAWSDHELRLPVLPRVAEHYSHWSTDADGTGRPVFAARHPLALLAGCVQNLADRASDVLPALYATEPNRAMSACLALLTRDRPAIVEYVSSLDDDAFNDIERARFVSALAMVPTRHDVDNDAMETPLRRFETTVKFTPNLLGEIRTSRRLQRIPIVGRCDVPAEGDRPFGPFLQGTESTSDAYTLREEAHALLRATGVPGDAELTHVAHYGTDDRMFPLPDPPRAEVLRPVLKNGQPVMVPKLDEQGVPVLKRGKPVLVAKMKTVKIPLSDVTHKANGEIERGTFLRGGGLHYAGTQWQPIGECPKGRLDRPNGKTQIGRNGESLIAVRRALPTTDVIRSMGQGFDGLGVAPEHGVGPKVAPWQYEGPISLQALRTTYRGAHYQGHSRPVQTVTARMLRRMIAEAVEQQESTRPTVETVAQLPNVVANKLETHALNPGDSFTLHCSDGSSLYVQRASDSTHRVRFTRVGSKRIDIRAGRDESYLLAAVRRIIGTPAPIEVKAPKVRPQVRGTIDRSAGRVHSAR